MTGTEPKTTTAFQPGVKTTYVRVGGDSVACYDSSPDDGRRPIVLLHGMSGAAEESFWALFPMLASKHRVVALDFVDQPDPGANGDTYLAQAGAVIEAVSPTGPADVVGYSFGAVIAATLAGIRPKLFRSLTLVAGWLKTDSHQLLRNDLWWSLYEDGHPALASFTVFAAHSPHFVNSSTPADLEALIARVRSGPDRAAKMRFNRSVDISEIAPRITAPSLVIGCTQDLMVPIRHSQLLFGAIPDARFATIDAGHAVTSERPSEIFAMVDSFVRHPHATPAGCILDNTHA